MSKTLVIAEKPSVGRDLARVLTGPFQKHEGWLEGPEHVITWAVGHLVQLAEPDEYDPKYKSWRMADLPIVPERFKLVVRDERSRKQMSVVTKQLGRDDVEEVVNACDAGREGELIFAYLYEKAKAKKPVQTAVAELDDERGDEGGVQGAAPGGGVRAAGAGGPVALGGRLDRGHERDARRDDPPAQLLRRRRVARARADADAGDRRPPRGGDQGVQARALLARGRDVRGRRRRRRRPASDLRRAPTPRAATPAPSPRIATEEEALAIVAACEGKPGTITKLEKKEQREKAPMLYDLTTLQREANNRYGFSAKRTLAAAQRLYEEHKALTYPRTNSRYLTTDMVAEIKPIAELVGAHPEYAKAAEYVTASTCCRSRAWSTTRRSPTTTRSSRRAPSTTLEKMGADDRRIYDMVARRFLAVFHPEAVFENTRVETTVTAEEKDVGSHVFRTRGKLLLVPGWRGRLRRGGRRDEAAGEEDEGADQQLPRLRAGRAGQTLEDRERAQGNQTAAALQRRVAAGRDGDGGQARRRRRAARGDEGLGDRHAGDPRGDHRAADPGRLRRARRARAGGHREGPERDQAARTSTR